MTDVCGINSVSEYTGQLESIHVEEIHILNFP